VRRKKTSNEDACHTSSCKQAWKNALEVNSVQQRRRRTKHGKDVPSVVDALPSASRLLRLFRKSQQSSTARVSHNGSLQSFPSSFLEPLVSPVQTSQALSSRIVGCPRHSGKYGRSTPNPLHRLYSIKFPSRSLNCFEITVARP